MNTHNPVLLRKTGEGETRILCINFNQDEGCFAVGHDKGFLVYNSNPIELRVKRNFDGSGSGAGAGSGGSGGGSGIGHVTMLHRTNYLALVGGGKNPKFMSNKLMIWDDLKKRSSLQLDFMSPILNVLLSRVRIIVVLKNHVLVYGFSSPPKKFAVYETIDNEFGLANLSSSTFSLNDGDLSLPGPLTLLSIMSSKSRFGDDSSRYQTLAFPGRTVGQIQLVNICPGGQAKNLVSIIKAHKSKIRCLALNRAGTLVASASETGTIIRVHSTSNTALLYEFRRGLDKAIITSMSFSHNDTKLAVLSDKNTLHIYNLKFLPSLDSPNERTRGPIHNPENRHHLLSSLPFPVPNYFKSTWSFCSINTNKFHTENSELDMTLNDVGVVGWASNDSVLIVWKNKKIWEKYVIVEKNTSSSQNLSSLSGNSEWEIVRFSWKKLDELSD